MGVSPDCQTKGLPCRCIRNGPSSVSTYSRDRCLALVRTNTMFRRPPSQANSPTPAHPSNQASWRPTSDLARHHVLIDQLRLRRWYTTAARFLESPRHLHAVLKLVRRHAKVHDLSHHLALTGKQHLHGELPVRAKVGVCGVVERAVHVVLRVDG